VNLKCKTLSDWHFNIIQCLYDWQTLASGILALIAAFITIYFLRKQIVQNNDFEVQKLRRKHDSFRVVLTLTLSQICSATEKAIYLLAKLRIQSSDTRKLSVTERRSLYSISPDVISSLQAIIETTDDKALISIIYRITRNIQVTVARIENMNTRHDSDLEEQIQDCTSIYTLVESLFEYARREINQCPDDPNADSQRS